MSNNPKKYAERVVLSLIDSKQIAPELFEPAVRELEAAIYTRLRQAAYNLAVTGTLRWVEDRVHRTQKGN